MRGKSQCDIRLVIIQPERMITNPFINILTGIVYFQTVQAQRSDVFPQSYLVLVEIIQSADTAEIQPSGFILKNSSVREFIVLQSVSRRIVSNLSRRQVDKGDTLIGACPNIPVLIFQDTVDRIIG